MIDPKHWPEVEEIYHAAGEDSFQLIETTLAGRYYIERKLGPGCLCNVYLARDKPELMSQAVVVKYCGRRISSLRVDPFSITPGN